MSLPILFPKLNVRLTIEGRTEELTINNVKSFVRGERMIVQGTYRDTFNGSGNMNATISGTASPAVANVPVFGLENQAMGATPTAAIAQIRYVASDDQTHTPPRPLIRRASGVLIGVSDTPVAAAVVPPPPYNSAAFTVNTATNVCTSATPHGFYQGDIIAIGFTAAPAPVTAAGLYIVVKLSATTFMLRTSGAGIVDFTGAGADCVAVLVTPIYTPLPPLEPGVFFYRDEWSPRLYGDAATGSGGPVLL